jgi:8-oxo-dGTP diphosphatase
MHNEQFDSGAATKAPLRAVAAVVESDGLFLIGQRCKDDTRGGQWEFPGGKIECGETPKQCLERELHEELGVRARIGTLLCTVTPNPDFHLTVHRATLSSHDLQMNEHDDLRWVPLNELLDFDLLEADRPVVEKLLADANAK